jgi:putative membrane protein
MEVYELPALNATLNAAAAVLLVSGWICIKFGKKGAHIMLMSLALLVSAAFLTSYLIYHFHVGSVKFQGKGIIRPVYFTILITHVLLAIANLPMIIMTVIPAVQRKFDRHKRVARWTLPVWLYVSVTGVVVYLMCYHWYAKG